MNEAQTRHERTYNLVAGTTSDVEFMHFPTPNELLDVLERSNDDSLLEKICREIPFMAKTRYYQERAVEAVITALGRGKKNALITLATGTGKTFISYQLVKKLVDAKWCRKSIGLRKPRVLFLADRNILADQAKESFVFPQNECYRLVAASEKPPMDRTVYFTLYQTLLGKADATKKFTDPEWDGEVVCAKCGKNPCECSEVAHKGKGNGMGGSANPCPKCGCQPCVCEKPQKNPVKVTLSGGRLIAAYWQDKVFFDNEMLSVADFLNRFAVAVRNATKSPELLCKCWADMEKRHDFIETLEVVGFNPDKLREIQRNTGNLACDILDVMLDIAYDVEPVTREFRAQKAKVKLVGLPKERESLLGVMLANYVRDGVWTLTAESFMDLLRQRYGSLVGAYSKLVFTTPRDALLFYGRIQKEIYAA